MNVVTPSRFPKPSRLPFPSSLLHKNFGKKKEEEEEGRKRGRERERGEREKKGEGEGEGAGTPAGGAPACSPGLPGLCGRVALDKKDRFV